MIFLQTLKNSRFSFFCIFGAIGFVIDGVICNYIYLNFNTTPHFARIISIFFSMNFSWIANRTFTFKINYFKSFKEWISYLSMLSVGVLINYFVFIFSLFILGETQINIWISLAAGSLSGLVFNYNSAKFLFSFLQKKSSR
jgi:putative flippase GtrA